MTALLEARGLSLPGRLFDVAISVSAGELVCLVGPNGSGKTSLLHALADVGGPSGDVWVDGRAPRLLGPEQRISLLSYLPASRELRWPLLARDLIALGGAGKDQVTEMVTMFDLAAVANRRVDRLSTGERNRVLIARSLAPKPKLLLLDEPTANLDPLWQIRLMEMLKSTLPKAGQAALVAVHDLDAAARWSDRIIVMQSGRIVADGAPTSVMARQIVTEVFGIERVNGEWRALLRPPADRLSSP
jgi:iron complex transport system ATP-binding protein